VDTINALNALLGNSDEEEELRREEEADRARAEVQAAAERAKAERAVRAKAFKSEAAEALRLQQLQMIFLDIPIFPAPGRALLTNSAEKDPAVVEISSLPETTWIEGALPKDADADAETEDEDDGKPRYLEPPMPSERLPGEFSIPIIPYPMACVPGSRVRLNLFEPRWLTLFSKLIHGKDETGLVLESWRGDARIDLSRNESCKSYEAKDDDLYEIIPGYGRMPETDFAARGTYGALYRRPDGKLASVGTAMVVSAHDVVVNGQVLSIYAKGMSRFKVLRVRQVNPYMVVDAVPIEDDGDGAGDVLPAAAEGAGEAKNNVVGATLKEEPVSVSDEAEFGTATASSAALATALERVMAADSYYSDAIGLGEAWSETNLRKKVTAMNDFAVADAMLYGKPDVALRLLASTSASERAGAVMGVVRGMEAAVAAGVTPRTARLGRTALSFAGIFALGFGLAAFRDAIDAYYFLHNGGGVDMF
jgi:Lon protease-like protein